MIIITQPAVTDAQIDHILARIEEYGLRSQVMRGESRVVIGVIGPDELIREKPLAAIPGVESVVPVMKPYKLAAQENGAAPPPVAIGEVLIGTGQRVALISGPCSVESKEQLISIASLVKKAGARVLRGGAYKPRTSPYSFQGLGENGLRIWPRPGLRPDCQLSPRSWTRVTSRWWRNMPIAFRSDRATCKILLS
jgi:3-deoxy-7-phosphoheptulonate synthase